MWAFTAYTMVIADRGHAMSAQRNTTKSGAANPWNGCFTGGTVRAWTCWLTSHGNCSGGGECARKSAMETKPGHSTDCCIWCFFVVDALCIWNQSKASTLSKPQSWAISYPAQHTGTEASEPKWRTRQSPKARCGRDTEFKRVSRTESHWAYSQHKKLSQDLEKTVTCCGGDGNRNRIADNRN